jgi:hypothetical protein
LVRIRSVRSDERRARATADVRGNDLESSTLSELAALTAKRVSV